MKKGDRVEVLDEALSGIVITVDDGHVKVKTEEGFERLFQKEELVVTGSLRVDARALERAKKEKRASRHRKPVKSKKKNRDERPMEVDLHIEELVSSTKNMSNYNILNHQLQHAEDQLRFALKKNIKRVVFIHGKGEGVLRAELRTLLRRYDRMEYTDANFREYGGGATEVIIY